jgi:hypothetical protein
MAPQFSGFINSIFEPVSNESVKFVQDRSSAICHFSSWERLEALTEYFNYILGDEITAYVLLERPKSMGLRMEEQLYRHLMDLHSPGGGFGLMGRNDGLDEEFLKWSEKQIRDLNLEDNLHNPFEDEDGSSELRKIRERTGAPLTMDTILDKITLSGYESLSAEEKNYLKNLSG